MTLETLCQLAEKHLSIKEQEILVADFKHCMKDEDMPIKFRPIEGEKFSYVGGIEGNWVEDILIPKVIAYSTLGPKLSQFVDEVPDHHHTP